jgi:hypothetical protein
MRGGHIDKQQPLFVGDHGGMASPRMRYWLGRHAELLVVAGLGFGGQAGVAAADGGVAAMLTQQWSIVRWGEGGASSSSRRRAWIAMAWILVL